MSFSWRSVDDESKWDAALQTLPAPHALQRWAWGSFKSRWGWSAQRWLLANDQDPVDILAAVQILKRRSGPVCVLYSPKGPVARDVATYGRVLDFLKAQARQQRAIWIKVDGDLTQLALNDPTVAQQLRAQYSSAGWRFSTMQVQFRNTGVTQISATEEDQLALMHQKWRYNIRLAARRGVSVRPGADHDFPLLYDMYAETGARDGFAIRERGYYFDAWRSMQAHALIAEREGLALAAVVLFGFAGRAYYFYGMSRTNGREHMPTYALQVEALNWARLCGYGSYDWWGAPDAANDPTDGMAGVWRWKEGFGARLVEGAGAWDYAPIPALAKMAGRFRQLG